MNELMQNFVSLTKVIERLEEDVDGLSQDLKDTAEAIQRRFGQVERSLTDKVKESKKEITAKLREVEKRHQDKIEELQTKIATLETLAYPPVKSPRAIVSPPSAPIAKRMAAANSGTDE